MALGVHGFCHSVGIEQERLSGLERHSVGLIAGIIYDPQGHALRLSNGDMRSSWII